MDTAAVAAAMAEPGFYPHRPREVVVRETAISWVFLAGELVYKLKKPVVLPFLDYGSRERRRELCRAEVRLNRRLTSDVYLGVRAVVERDGELALAPGDSDEGVEWAVEMRRLPEELALARRLPRLEPGDMRRVGRRLAEFHAEAEVAPASRGETTAVKRMIDDNLQTLASFAGGLLDRERYFAAARFSEAFIVRNRDAIDERAHGGRIRDGHGDLRLEHIVPDREVQVFDCVEFDPKLREIDVAADLAFLVMELASRARRDLADAVVAAYRDAGGDPGSDQLLPFYAVYRALVRAKLALIQADELDPEDPARADPLAEAEKLVALADRFRWRARAPLLLVLCGVTASGKTHLVRILAERSGLATINSDIVRKRLYGLDPEERGPQEIYSEEASRRTYAEMGRLATAVLKEGEGAIVDATFRRVADRRAFLDALADAAAAPIFVECRAPLAVLRERAGARLRERQPSDATPELVDEQLREFAPLDEIPAARHLPVRSDASGRDLLHALEAFLDRAAAAGSDEPGRGGFGRTGRHGAKP